MAAINDAEPHGGFPNIDPRQFRRREMRAWTLTLTEAFNLTPRMRRMRFAGEKLGEMEWRPGQDLVLSLPDEHGQVARRHYTIRRLTKTALDIDLVLHGDSPATRFARFAQPGAVIEAAGPRGRTALHAEANDHIFVGDETALPAIAAMAEALTSAHRGRLLIEIADDAERQDGSSPCPLAIEWVTRGQRRLIDRLRDIAPEPAGAHAYLLGETAQVRDQRHYLVERGFGRDQLTCEGYWRPGRIGGHDHV